MMLRLRKGEAEDSFMIKIERESLINFLPTPFQIPEI